MKSWYKTEVAAITAVSNLFAGFVTFNPQNLHATPLVQALTVLSAALVNVAAFLHHAEWAKLPAAAVSDAPTVAASIHTVASALAAHDPAAVVTATAQAVKDVVSALPVTAPVVPAPVAPAATGPVLAPAV